MKKIFLTSSLKGTKDALKDFLEDIDSDEVLFIPTASKVEEYTQYVSDAKDTFKNLGININELDISDIDREIVLEKIDDCKIIYFSGGNSFYLLQELERLDLINVLREKVQNGMIYVGESAGAIIASENIEYSQEMDDKKKAKNLIDYKGLSLIDFHIVPHFNEMPFTELADAIIDQYSDKIKLVPINNKEAIIVIDDVVEKK